MSGKRDARAEALHRLRSTLARVQAEAEVLGLDGANVAGVLGGLAEAFDYLAVIEAANEPELPAIEAAPGVAVLLEDDHRLGVLLTRQLGRLGISSILAESIAAAIEHARCGAQLVADLSVLQIADADQIETIRELRPILITGAVGGAAELAADRFSARATYTKPVRIGDLARAIQNAWEQGAQ